MCLIKLNFVIICVVEKIVEINWDLYQVTNKLKLQITYQIAS